MACADFGGHARKAGPEGKADRRRGIYADTFNLSMKKNTERFISYIDRDFREPMLTCIKCDNFETSMLVSLSGVLALNFH